MRNFILIVFALISQAIFSQTYTINDEGNINACSGTFTIGSHNAGDTFVMTICDDDPDSTHVAVNYSDWSFSGGDVLNVYEGTDVNAPLLGAFDQSNFQVPWAMTASPNNMTGCLTFEFISNGGGSTFSGTIHCQFNCQYFNAVIDSTSEQTDTLYTDICQGETVTFYASGDYNFNGGLYNQSDAQSTFTWDFADGTPAQTGQVVTHTFPNGGGYMIDCIITDQYGCRNSNDVDHRVRVSMTPHWTTSTDTICPDQATTIGATAGQGSAAAHADLWDNTPNMMISGTTFLPDGEGSSYSTTLLFDMFGAQTLDSISMLESICANLEHSYIGDLIMKITCPDGTTVILETQAGANTFLGEPIDDDNNYDPGVGYDYCWTPTPEYGTMGDEGDALLVNYSGGDNPTLPAGSYTSFESLDNLIGCPLNGQWTITIIDNWASDNGFIFNWGMTFAPSVYPDYWYFQNNIVNYDWTGENVISSQDTMVTVAPSTEGTVCYDVIATDNFGCEYTNQTCIWVLPANDPDCGCVTPPTTIDFSQPLCAGDNVTFTYSGAAIVSNSTFSWDFDGGTVVSGNILSAGPIEVSFPNNNTSYTIALGVQEGNCDPTDTTYTVNMPSELISTISGTDIKCYGDATGTIDLTVSDGTAGYSYNWTTANGSGLVVTDEDQSDLTAGTYDVTISDANTCTITNTYTINGPSQLSLTEASTDILCNGDANGTVTVNATGGTPNYTFDYGNGSQNNGNFTGLTGSTYTVTVTDSNNCVIVSNPIIVSEPDILTIGETHTNVSCYQGNDGSINLTVGGGTPQYQYNWVTSNGSGLVVSNEDQSNLTIGTYDVTVTDAHTCTITTSVEITEPAEILGTDTKSICEGDTYSFGTQLLSSAGVYTEVFQSNNGCDSTVTLTLLINPSPTPVITGDTYFCSGSTATISADAGYTSYLWNNNANTQSINVSNDGNYTVVVKDNNSCTGTATFYVFEDIVSIEAFGSTLICVGNYTDIFANISGGIPPYTYNWNNNVNTETQTINPYTDITLTVSGVDGYGCKTNEDSVFIQVSPGVNFDVYSNKDTICPGDPLLVTDLIQDGIPPYTIYDENGNVVTLNTIIYPEQAGVFPYTVIDGCNSTDVSNLTINFYPIPSLMLQADILQGCPPLQINFNTNITENDYSYMWNFDDINSNNLSLNPNPLHTFTSSGYYDITLSVTTTDGCKVSKTIEDMIHVFPTPIAKFDVLPDVMSILEPTFNFSNYSEVASSYIWNFDDGDSSSVFEPTHTYNNSGSYNVELVAVSVDGCKDTTKHTVRVKEIFTLYAPTAYSPDGDGINDSFYVVGHGIDTDDFLLTIYDRWGEIIWQTDDLFAKWDGYVKSGNKKAQNGSYVWKVVCKDFEGTEHEKAGTVTLIR